MYNFGLFWFILCTILNIFAHFFVCSCSFLYHFLSFFLHFPSFPALLTSPPPFLAYAFPYVMAFSTNAIEVRTLINGKLVQTLELPSLRLLTSKRGIYITICRDGAQEVLRVAAHTAE